MHPLNLFRRSRTPDVVDLDSFELHEAEAELARTKDALASTEAALHTLEELTASKGITIDLTARGRDLERLRQLRDSLQTQLDRIEMIVRAKRRSQDERVRERIRELHAQPRTGATRYSPEDLKRAFRR